MRSNIIIAGGVLLFIAIVVADRKPVGLQADKAWVTEEGIVTEMYETAFKDLVLKLQGPETYYIDGASELGITLKDLRDKVLYKTVVIQYPERWNPLKTDETRYYISKLESDGEIIFHDDK